jgi:hypothetical protein
MSHGSAEKSETGFVAVVGTFFLILLLLCGVEFADDAAKTGLQNAGGGHHH